MVVLILIENYSLTAYQVMDNMSSFIDYIECIIDLIALYKIICIKFIIILIIFKLNNWLIKFD